MFSVAFGRARLHSAFAETMKVDPPSWELKSERCSVCGEGELVFSRCPACATVVLICAECSAVFSIQQKKPEAEIGMDLLATHHPPYLILAGVFYLHTIKLTSSTNMEVGRP